MDLAFLFCSSKLEFACFFLFALFFELLFFTATLSFQDSFEPRNVIFPVKVKCIGSYSMGIERCSRVRKGVPCGGDRKLFELVVADGVGVETGFTNAVRELPIDFADAWFATEFASTLRDKGGCMARRAMNGGGDFLGSVLADSGDDGIPKKVIVGNEGIEGLGGACQGEQRADIFFPGFDVKVGRRSFDEGKCGEGETMLKDMRWERFHNGSGMLMWVGLICCSIFIG